MKQAILAGVRKAVSCLYLKPDDRFIIVSDIGVDVTVREALHEAMSEVDGQSCWATYVMSDEPTGSAQPFNQNIEEQLASCTAWLFVTSMSRTHCEQTRKYVLEQKTARLLSVTNARSSDIFTMGAVNENLEEMRVRIRRIAELCEGVRRFCITSDAGTGIFISPDLEYCVSDDGIIDTPGKLSNFPFGEWACPVIWAGSGGVVISDGVIGSGIGSPDEPLYMDFWGGKMSRITGGESAKRLAEIMTEADRKAGNRALERGYSGYLAEIAFGANSCAWRGDRVNGLTLPPTSLEAEKAYCPGDTSIHIAHGCNHAFGVHPNAPHFNSVGHHTDHVLRGGVTVIAYYEDRRTPVHLIDRGIPIY